MGYIASVLKVLIIRVYTRQIRQFENSFLISDNIGSSQRHCTEGIKSSRNDAEPPGGKPTTRTKSQLRIGSIAILCGQTYVVVRLDR